MRGAFSRVLQGLLLRARRMEPDPGTGLHTGAPGPHAGAPWKMVVGLGNPGLDGTRHSVGRAVLNAVAGHLGLQGGWRGDRQLAAELILTEVEGRRVVLLKPRLLMNRSGAAVAKAVSKFGLKVEDVLLVHDELDKPLGKIALKLGGSARGHNGVRSCVSCLHSEAMPRLRVGIGRPSGRTSVERHVLGRFSSEERTVLDLVLDQSVDLVLSLISQRPQSPGGGAAVPQRDRNKERERQRDRTERQDRETGQRERTERERERTERETDLNSETVNVG